MWKGEKFTVQEMLANMGNLKIREETRKIPKV